MVVVYKERWTRVTVVLSCCRAVLLLVAVFNITISGSKRQICWLAINSFLLDLGIGIQELEHSKTRYAKELNF